MVVAEDLNWGGKNGGLKIRDNLIDEADAGC